MCAKGEYAGLPVVSLLCTYNVLSCDKFAMGEVCVTVPYGCAGLAGMTVSLCMLSPALINTQALISVAKTASGLGTIDNIKNMANDKIFIYNGRSDSVVKHGKLGQRKEQISASIQTNLISAVNQQGRSLSVIAWTIPTMTYNTNEEKHSAVFGDVGKTQAMS